MKNKKWNRDETYEKFLKEGIEPLEAIQKVEALDSKRRQVIENGGKVLSSGGRDSSYVLEFAKDNPELFEGLGFIFNNKILEDGMIKIIENSKGKELTDGEYKELVALNSCKEASKVFKRYKFIKKTI